MSDRERLLKKKSLSIPDAMRLMECGRDKVESMLSSGAWRGTSNGTRTSVVTASIIAQVDRDTRFQRRKVGLETIRANGDTNGKSKQPNR